MSGLLSAMQTGKSSLLSSQKAIEVTGENIANVNTPGYSRQSPQFSSLPTLSVDGLLIGQGVRIDDVTRAHDDFLTRQINSAGRGLGEEEGKAVPLAELERIVGISENGLSGRIDRFFESWQQLAADPGNQTARDAVLQQGESLAREFNDMASSLQSVRQGINDSLGGDLEGINAQLAEVAELNLHIVDLESTGASANGARDRRDQLLAELTRSIGVSSYESENGSVSVHLPGGLPPLVQDGEALSLVGKREGGDLRLTLRGKEVSYGLDADNFGGEFKGQLSVRDGLVPELQAGLDHLAFSLATEINAQHRAGSGLDGVSRDFFAPPAAEAGAAGFLSVALADAGEVAAGAGIAAGDNTNALAMAALGQAPLVGGAETFVGAYGTLAGRVGTEVRQNELNREGGEDAMVQLQNLRDSQVGVSLEEEMVKLIEYQKGFEASAKFLATVDEMMDTLLNLKR